jgi:phenylalanyl-tRNA synthetase alpha chain
MEPEAHEAKVLLFLKERGRAWMEEVEEGTGMGPSTVMRAVLGLVERGYLSVGEERSFLLSLTPEGRRYAAEGLPERRMLEGMGEGKRVEELLSSGSKEEATIALGWLRRKGLAEVVGGEVRPTPQGRRALSERWPEEELLERLLKGEEVSLPKLSPEVQLLRRRGLVEVREKTRRLLSLTEEGRGRAGEVRVQEEVTELTHELLVSGRWREARLKRYEPSEDVPPLYPGRIHPQGRVIEEVREALLAMGFVEIKSRAVESEFWNFDALFQAQDHPAREIHSNFTLSRPSVTRLPASLLRKVAKAHERGVEGSKGWGYRFNPEISRRAVLCSQTTAATVRYLASHPHPPLKVFCIDRVYRHERIDYKHLAEFYQCEGIVMDEGLTFRDMLGYLKLILQTLGFGEVRFRPGYFPFTEPSVEAEVYHPERGEWVEVLGAGMFRPELLRPLGVRHPVLAWGIGLSRIVMMRLGLEDIRDIFCTDLEALQNWGLRGR